MNLIARRESEPPSNFVTEKKTILGDPDAELVVLLSQDRSGDYQVSSVVRILGHRQTPLNVLIDMDLRADVAQVITEEMQRSGASAYGFLNREEAADILNDKSSSPLGDVLRQQDFSRGIRVVDIKLGQ